jgi:prophage regulatory protein
VTSESAAVWAWKSGLVDRQKGICAMNKSLGNIPPEARLLRLPDVLEIIPISKSSWWAGVKTGRYPQPVKLGPRMTCWRLSDLSELAETGTYQQNQSEDHDL